MPLFWTGNVSSTRVIYPETMYEMIRSILKITELFRQLQLLVEHYGGGGEFFTFVIDQEL